MWQLLKKFAILWKPSARFPEVNMGWKKCSGILRNYLAFIFSKNIEV